jgi:hypothetical protein
MAQDNRRVQTAVLGSPESDYPLSLPMDRGEARRYLAKYGTQRLIEGVPRPAWTICSAGLVQTGQPELALPVGQRRDEKSPVDASPESKRDRSRLRGLVDRLREVQRAHAFYATMPRPMPPRPVPRADPSVEQA